MGNKVSPLANRIPLTKRWQSQWFANHKQFGEKISEDLLIRKAIEKSYADKGAIAKVDIAHRQAEIEVTIHSARPGVLIGRQGQGIAEVRNMLEKKIGRQIKVEVREVRRPEANAQLVAQSIGGALARNIAYRRVCKQALEKAMSAGAKGIKILVAGRLGGSEIARSQKFTSGSLPSTSLKRNIDFVSYALQTSYGTIGIKVWIYKDAEPEEA